MEDTIYWVWLLQTLGGSTVLQDLLQYFGSARKLYEAGASEWRICGLMTAKQIAALSRVSPSECGGVLEACRENGWFPVTPDMLWYPRRLWELRDMPPVLFTWGDVTVLERKAAVSVVGTRRASAYGVRVASLLTETLASAGAVIVSGGALGIDSAAHEGALRAEGGKTVAVLGCGLGTDYLRENVGLRKRIAQNGVVVSEFLPFAPASRYTFPRRNRIISCLSLGTVVIEAGEKSGSLITARCALEQGRDLFAVPGDVVSSAFTGANRLIRDGAVPVFSPRDVLAEYLPRFPGELHDVPDKSFGELLRESGEQPETLSREPLTAAAKPRAPKNAHGAEPPAAAPAEKRALPESLSENAQKVYAALEPAGVHIDDLSERAGLPAGTCLAALTELEVYGFAALSEGRKYRSI